MSNKSSIARQKQFLFCQIQIVATAQTAGVNERRAVWDDDRCRCLRAQGLCHFSLFASILTLLNATPFRGDYGQHCGAGLRAAELLRAQPGQGRTSKVKAMRQGKASDMHGCAPPQYKSTPDKRDSPCSMIYFAIVIPSAYPSCLLEGKNPHSKCRQCRHHVHLCHSKQLVHSLGPIPPWQYSLPSPHASPTGDIT